MATRLTTAELSGESKGHYSPSDDLFVKAVFITRYDTVKHPLNQGFVMLSDLISRRQIPHDETT